MISREGAGNLPGDKQEPGNETRGRRSLHGALSRLFRNVKAALTGEQESPKPRRKRSTDDPRGLFKRACSILDTRKTRHSLFRLAGKILRRVVRHRNDPSNFAWDMLPDYSHTEHLRQLRGNTGAAALPLHTEQLPVMPERSAFSRTAEPARHIR